MSDPTLEQLDSQLGLISNHLGSMARQEYVGFPFKAELILRWFEAVPEGPVESQDQGNEAQEGFQRPRGVPPCSSKALLGLFSLIPVFSWAPWNCLKAP